MPPGSPDVLTSGVKEEEDLTSGVGWVGSPVTAWHSNSCAAVRSGAEQAGHDWVWRAVQQNAFSTDTCMISVVEQSQRSQHSFAAVLQRVLHAP